MGKLSGKQVCSIFGILLLGLLLCIGLSDTGQRLAMAAAQPVTLTKNFLQTQLTILCEDDADQRQKIHALENKVQELEQDLRDIQVLRKENKQLRQTLALRQFPAWHCLRAEILTRDPAAWDLTFTINRGEAEGVIPGAPVLFQQWMIGRVAAVHQHSAVVHTLISPQCRIGVKLEHSDYNGLMTGMGIMHSQAPGCMVNFLPIDANTHLGATLVTSGLGGVIPEGIPLACVAPDRHGTAIQEVEHARKMLYATPLAPWNDFRIVSLLLPN